MLDKRRAKKAEQGQDTDLGKSGSGSGKGGKAGDKGKDENKERKGTGYRQREVVDRASGLENKGMDSVLGSVFG